MNIASVCTKLYDDRSVAVVVIVMMVMMVMAVVMMIMLVVIILKMVMIMACTCMHTYKERGASNPCEVMGSGQ